MSGSTGSVEPAWRSLSFCPSPPPLVCFLSLSEKKKGKKFSKIAKENKKTKYKLKEKKNLTNHVSHKGLVFRTGYVKNSQILTVRKKTQFENGQKTGTDVSIKRYTDGK